MSQFIRKTGDDRIITCSTHFIRTPLRMLVVLTMVLLSGVLFAQNAPDITGDLQAIEIEPININRADAETIARVLLGIGNSRAEAIVDYREQYGEFHSLEELQMVRGVGEVTLKNNADRIRFD